ncbi:pyrroline-5-carboxylate reductase [Acidomonas methanolica]|nr:pyrroline-5-carboxylate reductase [Acidomonas methanolica]MBU2654969.1 pyrroline-5-carboxylate reductase [Acidomonas methanolica]TCS26320.1 pyrroline-5-carboxylate reductase [Acidomonas methanolica]
MSETLLPQVLLVGCGNMGGALWSGWERSDIAPSVILDRHCASPAPPHRVARTPEEIPAGFRPEFVVLAVKPGGAEQAVAAVAPWLEGATLLSVMAGRRCGGLRAAARAAGHDAPVIRAMPNMPSSIGRGVTGVYAEPEIGLVRTMQAEALMRAVGQVAWVEREEQLDLVTALSGSGPAYVYLLAELLEQIGVTHGLPPDTARLLARGTVAGAGAVLDASATDAATLRRNVTSPNGTTAAALNVLMQPDAWPDSLARAIAAATARAAELAR